jgi:hypothetical protein
MAVSYELIQLSVSTVFLTFSGMRGIYLLRKPKGEAEEKRGTKLWSQDSLLKRIF